VILGGQDRQINVHLDAIQLAAAGVSAIDVQRAIASSNVSVPGGTIERGPLNRAPGARRAARRAVVLLFLGNLRSTIIAAIAIPTSIIATFGLIWYMGFTLNLMTLLALTLAVGIVIDDAIVVLENIYRFIEEKHDEAVPGGGSTRPRRSASPCSRPRCRCGGLRAGRRSWAASSAAS
jgi:multidrug efflux pump subunit AcrB